MKKLVQLLILTVVLSSPAFSQVVNIGSGSYNLTFPQPDLAKYPGSLGYPLVGVNPGGNMDDGRAWAPPTTPQGVFNAAEMYPPVGGSNNPPKYVPGSFNVTKTRYPTQQHRSYPGPFQSHEWYTSASWNFEDTSGTQRQAGIYKYRHFSWGMHPHPLNLMARNRGMFIKCNQVINTPGLVGTNGPRNNEFGAFIGNSGANFNYFQSDGICVGLQGMNIPLMEGTKVSAHGDWTATIEFDHQNKQDKLFATSGRGVPYVFFERQGPNKLPVNISFPGVAYIYRVTANGSFAMRVNIDGGRYQWFGVFLAPDATMDKLGPGNATGNFLVRNLTSPGTPLNPRPPGNPYWQPTWAADGLGRAGTAAEQSESLGTVWQFSLPSTNYFSVAALPDSSLATFKDFENHAFNFVTDSKISYSYDECKALLTTTFDATITNYGPSTDPNNTIMGLYPHQWKHTPILNPINTSYIFGTPRGTMKMARTKSFSTQMYFKGLIPYMPGVNNVPSSSPEGSYSNINLNTYLNTFMSQPQWLNFGLDNVYGFSKKIEQVDNLVSIAFQLNHPNKYRLLDTLKAELQKWFTAPAGDNYKMFHYDPVWNALCGYPSAFDAAPALNDQHFHYGPYIKASATIAKFDKTWAANYKGMVEMVIKAANNWDRSDTKFQYLRYFDPYAGHSWAGGHANSDKGLNQESSSEALNFAAATMLWGEQTGDAATRDLGILLYLTESEAAKYYYFDIDGDTHPNTSVAYGIEPNRNHAATYTPKHIAILWDAGGDYQTYYSGDPEEAHGIHYLPFSSTSLYWGHKSGTIAKNNYAEMLANNAGTKNSNYWQHLFPKLVSMYDPQQAINDWNANGKSIETAQSYAFIHSMFTLGKVVDDVYADMAGYNVFEKDGCKHYVVYNPKGAFQKSKVTFTDGNCFLLPQGDSLYVFTKCPLPLKPDTTYIICPGSTVDLTAKDTICSSNYKWDRNGTAIAGATNKTYTASLAGTYHVSYNISSCIVKKDSFVVILKDTLDIKNIQRTCNAGGTAYTLTFDISGGDAASYAVTVNGGGKGGPGSLAGSKFTSGLINSGDSYSFIIKDKNGCDPDTISGSMTCSCITRAGTMNVTPMTICDTAKATAVHNGDQVLDANDLLRYYLHSQNGTTLGTVVASSSTPTFGFTAGMVYGTTYYISAVAGNNDGTGKVNLLDLCLSVAPGTPVVFNPKPIVNIGKDTTLCPTASVILDAGAAASYNWSTAETSQKITVNAAGTYSVTITDANGCKNSDTVVVGSVTSVLVTNLLETCNGLTDYTVSFDMSGGDAASYKVVINGASPGGPGAHVGNTFTSAAIPSGGSYSFTVTDKNNCTPKVFAGTKNCSCITSAGAMDAAPLTVCETTVATAIATTGSSLDVNDVLVYYLHDNNGTTLGTVYATSNTPSFSYLPALTPGATYFISAVAGNNNGSGGVDLADPCLSVAKGTPVVFSGKPTTSIAGTDFTVCGSTASLKGNTVAVGTGIWIVKAGGATVSSPTSAVTNVTGLAVGANTFTWTIINGACPPSSTDITVTSEAAPSLTSAGATQTICKYTTSLAADVPTVGIGAWTVVAGKGTVTDPSDRNSSVTGLSTGLNTFKWSVTNGSCPAVESTVDILVDTLPTISNAGTSQSVCSDIYTLNANKPVIGVGTWSTPGVSNITNATLENSGVTNLALGANTFKWTIKNGVCPVSESSVTITRDTPPTLTLAGSVQNLCQYTTTLAADAPTVGTGSWTVSVGKGVFADPNDRNSGVSGLATGKNTFKWTVSNGSCPTVESTVDINVDTLPTKSVAGIAESVCVDSYTLKGNKALVGVGTWTTTGAATIINPNIEISGVTGLAIGANTFEWSIVNGVCPADKSTVTITREATVAVSAGSDQKICLATAALDGNVALGTWTKLTGAGSVTTPSDPKSGVTGLSKGKNTFEWSVIAGSCPAVRDTVEILVDEDPSQAAVGVDQTICGSNALLSGKKASVGIGKWIVKTGPATLANDADSLTSVSGLQTGLNTFTWVISNGTCNPTQKDLNITVLPPPTQSFAGVDDTLCNTTAVNLNANAAAIGSGTWNVIVGPAKVTTPSDEKSGVTGLAIGINKFSWVTQNATCKDSSEVSILVDELPTSANAGSDQTICSNSTVLAGNSPTKGTGKWSVVSGPAKITSATSPTSTITALAHGSTSVLKWTIHNGVCKDTSDNVIVKVDLLPELYLGADSTICPSDSVTLKTGLVGTYKWNTGSTAQSIVIRNDGIYKLTVTTINNCVVSDSIEFKKDCPLTIYIPNSFSPNGDLKNDRFTVYGENILDFKMTIHNRWGECFFTTEDMEKGWDGKTPAGQEAKIDVYVYSVNYARLINGKKQTMRAEVGTVALTR